MFMSTHSVLAVGVGIAIGLLLGTQRRLKKNQEQIMAKFDALNAHLAEMKTALGETADRVEEALRVKGDDSADQAAVDAADAELAAAIGQLRGIAAQPAPEPEPEPEPAPEF